MNRTQSPIQIPGYTYGTSAVAKSPFSEQDFDLQALWRLILKAYFQGLHSLTQHIFRQTGPPLAGQKLRGMV